MNKILSIAVALLCVILFPACDSKGDCPFDCNGGDCPFCKAEGMYTVTRTIRLRMPSASSFLPVTHETWLEIESQGDSYLNITLPGVIYKLGEQEMNLPTFTLRNVPVMRGSKGELVIPKYSFTQKVDKKYAVGTLEGELETDGDVDLDVEFKYGDMPYYIIQEYETPDYR